MLSGGVSGRAAVGLQGQLALQVLDHTLQALPSFSLLLELLSQLLPVGLGLLELHVQLFDLQGGGKEKGATVRRGERHTDAHTELGTKRKSPVVVEGGVCSPEWNT